MNASNREFKHDSMKQPSIIHSHSLLSDDHDRFYDFICLRYPPLHQYVRLSSHTVLSVMPVGQHSFPLSDDKVPSIHEELRLEGPRLTSIVKLLPDSHISHFYE